MFVQGSTIPCFVFDLIACNATSYLGIGTTGGFSYTTTGAPFIEVLILHVNEIY